jgi:hypothetical protein
MLPALLLRFQVQLGVYSKPLQYGIQPIKEVPSTFDDGAGNGRVADLISTFDKDLV